MPRIKLFLMRHSKSCSNHLRESEDDTVSQAVRDPGLTEIGTRWARDYAPVLRERLGSAGFDIDGALIGASALRRAQDTARIVFGRNPVVMPHFTENGAIPENTSEGSTYAAPNWQRFVAHVSTLAKDGASVAVVGHGSFLRSLWPHLTGAERAARLNNMDGILLDADVSASGLHVRAFKEFRHEAASAKAGGDRCGVVDNKKISTLKRMRQRQRGGGVNMPQAYFQDGVQMRGTFGEATGVGLAGAGNGWVRAPLAQTGGRTRRQRGGFSASIMGSFAANGARLVPLATYLGYKMYTNQKKTKKRSRKTRRRAPRT